MVGCWEPARRATARQPMWANARERLNRNQVGCRWIRPGTNCSEAVTVSRVLNSKAGETQSTSRVRHRTRDNRSRLVPILHPSNGEATRLRSPADPERSTWLHTHCSTDRIPAVLSCVSVQSGILDACANTAIKRERPSRKLL